MARYKHDEEYFNKNKQKLYDLHFKYGKSYTDLCIMLGRPRHEFQYFFNLWGWHKNQALAQKEWWAIRIKRKQEEIKNMKPEFKEQIEREIKELDDQIKVLQNERTKYQKEMHVKINKLVKERNLWKRNLGLKTK